MNEEITVHYFERKPGPNFFSLERVFSDVRKDLPPDIHAKVFKCPYESQGILNRVRNMLWARRNAGPVNHVAGDVHYRAIALPKGRTVLTIADCVSLVRNRGIKRWLLWLFWYRLPTSRARAITTISEFTKQQILENVKCDAAKVLPIHCSVSRAFRPGGRSFDHSRPTILQVGTVWNKNVCRVAQALRGINCRLEIVGALNDKQLLALQTNGIDFTQHERVSDQELVSLYQACDLVVFASIYEGFGLPIIEAQAAGRPLVTSALSSMPEVAGDGACFVDPFDVQSIRKGILKIIKDEAYRADLVEKGLANVKRFAPDLVAARYAGLYRTISS